MPILYLFFVSNLFDFKGPFINYVTTRGGGGVDKIYTYSYFVLSQNQSYVRFKKKGAVSMDVVKNKSHNIIYFFKLKLTIAEPVFVFYKSSMFL